MAFDSRPTPPSRACPGRGVSPSGPGSRDSRDDEVRGREHAATAAVVVPLGCVVDRDFVPRSWAPGRSGGWAGGSVCDAAASASPLPAGPRTAPRHPHSRFRRATVRRPTLGSGHRPRPRPPPPPPPLLRSCTVTGSALSACACNTQPTITFVRRCRESADPMSCSWQKIYSKIQYLYLMELSLELANKIRVYNLILYTLYVATIARIPSRQDILIFSLSSRKTLNGNKTVENDEEALSPSS